MLADKARAPRASTEALFSFLGTFPWWAIIIGIIGLLVSFSVLTNARYRDAIYFIFDLPWDKELVAEMPASGESWTYTPDPSVPLRPGSYRLYAEFYQAEAGARENVILRETPNTEAPRSLTLVTGARVTFERWHIIPRQGLTPEQRWVYVVTESGVGG